MAKAVVHPEILFTFLSPDIDWWLLLLALIGAFSIVVWSARTLWKERGRQLDAPSAPVGESNLFARSFRPRAIADLRPGDLNIVRHFSYYAERPDLDSTLGNLLEARQDMVLTGPSGAGKSRAVLEAVRQSHALKGFTLLLPDGPILKSRLAKMEPPKGDLILILDDFNRFCDPYIAAGPMLEFLAQGDGATLVIGLLAGPVAGSRYEQYGERFGPLQEVPVGPLTRDQLATIAEKTSCQDILKEARDLTPLSTLLPLERLQSRYGNLQRDERLLLNLIAVLQSLALPLSESLVGDLFEALRPEADLSRMVGAARSNGFIEQAGDRFVVSDRLLAVLPAPDPAIRQVAIERLRARAQEPELWQAGLALFAEGDSSGAEACFQPLLTADLSDPALLAYGAALGLPPASGPAEASQEEPEAEPDSEAKEAALELAVQGQTEAAILKLREVIADDATDADCHFWLAEMHQRQGELEAAERHFRHGLRADAHDPYAHLAYAAFLEKRQNERGALGELMTASLLLVADRHPDPVPFVRCTELAKKLEDPHTGFLAAGFYAGIQCLQGHQKSAAPLLSQLKAEAGRMPMVDGIVQAIQGKSHEEVTGDDLEARAARTLTGMLEDARRSAASVE